MRVHFTDHFKSLTVRENLDRATIQKRLLLCLHGLGTNYVDFVLIPWRSYEEENAYST